MRAALSCSLGLIAFLALALAPGASADVTIGSTAIPAGSSAASCGDARVWAPVTSDPTIPYDVPASGGTITAWQTSTTGVLPADAGAPVTFLVLRPAGAGDYDVLATDARTLPNPLPASGIASYTLPAPVPVRGGDALGLFTNNASAGAVCFHFGGSTPLASRLTALDEPVVPAAGQRLSRQMPDSDPGYMLNLAATVNTDQDAAVATSASPAAVTLGNVALLASTVRNNGPAPGPITFTDTVPAGLTIESALAGSGACTTSGQQVTCTVSLAPGQAAPVNIVVRPTAVKTYANVVAVSPAPGGTETNPANNTASATLAVGPAPVTPKCIVPSLKRTPQSVAKRVLKLLGCKVGKTKRAHSKSIAKGLVVKTAPKPGTYAAGKTVKLTVSSGPKKKTHKK
jgi:uncharacterized repeat protein (TIGR01451 family)